MTRRQRTITRDSIVMSAALTLSAYEIVIGDGRPWVLAFLGALLGAPVLAQFDRSERRERQDDRDDDRSRP